MKLRNFDFVGNRNKFFIASLVIIAIIIVCSFVLGIKVDVQFKGGTIITYNYSGELDFGELESFVESNIMQDVRIDQKGGIAGGENSFDIVLTSEEGLNADVQSTLSQQITEKYGDQLSFLSISSVNPTIGKEFFTKGLAAIIFASIVLVIYIGFRFKRMGGFSAGIAAIIALIHDTIFVFGTFVILQIPIDNNFIAVILTILGYSINDTIIIYDRIRENQKHYGKSMTIREIVNRSINESLSRTINTSIAVLGTLVVVCVVAITSNVPSIVSFAFPMLIGAISGTYSTIFVAGPLWVMWKEYKEKHPRKAKKNAGKVKIK